MATSYFDKLKDPRWQKKRLEVFERDEWKCSICGTESKQLHVHHRFYRRRTDPWAYEDYCYMSLCEKCHTEAGEFVQSFDETFKRKFIPRHLMNISDALLCSSEISSTAIGVAIVELLGDDLLINYLVERRFNRVSAISEERKSDVEKFKRMIASERAE